MGDTLTFANAQTGEELRTRVVELQRFPDFFALYKAFDKVEIGYCEGEEANAEDMYAYYSKEDIARYGALAIVIALL